MIKKKIVIKGSRIHNITYRFFLYDEALRLGLRYFDAKNIKNSVEIINVLAGGGKKEIELFVEFAKKNFPPLAEVSEVLEEDYSGKIKTTELFERGFMLEQQSKTAFYGLNMLGKQDLTLGKQDKMIEKQDLTVKKLGEIKQDTQEIKEALEKLPAIYHTIFEELEKIKKALNRAGIEIS